MTEKARSWKTSYRCINNSIDRPPENFGADIAARVNVKLYFGAHRFNAYFRLEDAPDEYLCRVRTLPHIYERRQIARDQLHPYFVSEALSIVDALANGKQYLASPMPAAPGLPIGLEYDYHTPEHVSSWTSWSPPEQTRHLRMKKGLRVPPWPRAANAFLYAITLLNRATVGTMVMSHPAENILPRNFAERADKTAADGNNRRATPASYVQSTRRRQSE